MQCNEDNNGSHFIKRTHSKALKYSVAITVGELFRLHNGAQQNTTKSPTRTARASLTPSPVV
uniref:Uncharacterized protein n=1 Tax=Glossina brevipalpis TaxID=37001 RepID=A0A1A9WBH4_9MUSC